MIVATCNVLETEVCWSMLIYRVYVCLQSSLNAL